VLLSDNAPDRELAHARSLQDVPCNPVGLCELGDGGGADRHDGQACQRSGERERDNGERWNAR
jgi:hypothetical protein